MAGRLARIHASWTTDDDTGPIAFAYAGGTMQKARTGPKSPQVVPSWEQQPEQQSRLSRHPVVSGRHPAAHLPLYSLQTPEQH